MHLALRHEGCSAARMMIYSALAGVFVGAVVVLVVRRELGLRHASRTATQRDVERAEGEGMVLHPLGS